MKRELELYIHIPFCMKKCAYCDFLSGPAPRETIDRYVTAVSYTHLDVYKRQVDARSYEERGIDKIPMVHEGPNVQAMEARGISTALGSLNRLIRALNDMKERAKNLLQWSLLRQSQLMERMLFLHQPTLADYLRNYYDKRNAVAESHACLLYTSDGVEEEIQEALAKIVIHNIIKRRFTIDRIKKGVKLC